MNKIIALIPLLLFFLTSHSVLANEIHYGSINDIKDHSVLLKYKGPSGTNYFICNIITSNCKDYKETAPHLFPEIFNVNNYVNSPGGKYAISPITIKNTEANLDIVYNILYSFNGDEPNFVSMIPYYKETTRIVFSPNENSVLLFGTDGEVASYNIKNSDFVINTLSQSEFPFRSISMNGNYLAAYNYVHESHVIWDVWTGEEIIVPSTKPGYVEFSDNEKDAVYIDTHNNSPVLHHIDLADFENATSTGPLFKSIFTVEDFLFVNDDLYYMSNEIKPYDWTITRYNLKTKKKIIVEQNASYGDYIRRIDGNLAYLIIEGKNSNIALYNPKINKSTVLRPIEASETPSEIKRTVVKYGDINGVLLTPPKQNSDKPLFVWLHGGPIRQTSLNYHPYLSYAVYDEILEKIALSGSYVLKLDYTGSYGYTSEFNKTLTNNIGIQDVQDVINSVKQLKQSKNFNNIYLIGNSYGGYLGLRTLVEEPELFTGAISISGVFDWFTLIERIKSSPFKKYFDGVPNVTDLDHNFEQYLKASIYSQVTKLTDEKILLVFGENDSTVPVWQTKEMFYFLKGMEKDVSLLSFEDEDHIIRNRENLDNLCLFIENGLELQQTLNCNQ